MHASMSAWTAVATIAGAVLAVIGVYVAAAPLRRRIATMYKKADRALDDVLGTVAIVHPETGEELLPARPGIGTRVGRVEDAVAHLANVTAVDATAAARAAVSAASAAEASAVAASQIATVATGQATETLAEVRRLGRQVKHWQRADRVQAETAVAALHEIGGIDITLPDDRNGGAT